MGWSTRLTVAVCSLVLAAAWLATPTAASAKTRKMKSCASAEATLAATGVGDRDGDGLSDCRETKQLRTSPTLEDTDGDGASDGMEVADHSDPRDRDSDDDGLEDGHDSDPRIPIQRIKAFLDGVTCPQLGVPGSLSALGISVILDDRTEFDDVTCEEMAAMLVPTVPPAPPAEPVRVDVRLVEDSTGVLTAVEVEAHTCDRMNKDEGDGGDDHGDDD